MKILFIAKGYLPYTFSENLCNGKLVYAMQEYGWQIDVISGKDEGVTYSNEWSEPWTLLKESNIEVQYQVGNRVVKYIDTLFSAIKMCGFLSAGVRWANRAYKVAYQMHKINNYDVVITRSPSDIPHVVGYKLSKKTGVKWIANWNDPSSTIWPEPYKHKFSKFKSFYLEYYTKLFLKQADVNTFPSHSLRDHFEKNFPFLQKKKTSILPHIALSESIYKLKKYKKGNLFRMCHSGNMSNERNPELLFQAIRMMVDNGMENIRLDIMGHVNPYTSDLMLKYKLENYVKFIGAFPYLESVNKLQEYDILVLLEAILDKGIFFPSKITDYAQSMRPILAVSPSVGFANELVSKYGGGKFVDNKNVKDIYNGILEMYGKWDSNDLLECYSSEKLYDYCSAKTVIEYYKKMLNL